MSRSNQICTYAGESLSMIPRKANRFLRPELSIIASNRDPIEFSGAAPEKEERDAQEKGPEVDDEIQISGAEGKAALENADEDEKEVEKGGSSVPVAHTVIA
ncbi:hypothetical protein BGZ89_003633 [Linnemannia elongata]|nr:hypothetical protein BGZ89_003633 [Linnemannia elongata]